MLERVKKLMNQMEFRVAKRVIIKYLKKDANPLRLSILLSHRMHRN